MKTNFYIILILSALLSFSCSKDNDENVVAKTPMQNDCTSGLNKTLYTECCVEGPIQANPDEIIFLTYTSNFESEMYDWEVLGNSMTLVEGANTTTAKFRTAKNFVKDSIRVFSRSINDAKACSYVLEITVY